MGRLARALLLGPVLCVALSGCGREDGPGGGLLVTAIETVTEGRGAAAEAGDPVALRFTVLGADGVVLQTAPPSVLVFATADRPEPGRGLFAEAPVAAALVGMRAGERRRLALTGHARAAVLEVERVDVPPVAVETLEEGAGPPAERGETIRLSFTVLGPDGAASAGEGERAEVELARRPGGLVEGALRGLWGIRVGERRRIVVPAALAYGDVGHPPEVEPGAGFAWEVERLP